MSLAQVCGTRRLKMCSLKNPGENPECVHVEKTPDFQPQKRLKVGLLTLILNLNLSQNVDFQVLSV